MTDRICQRIISPETHPRNGCRCARPNFTPNTRSCSPSARAPWPSMPRPAKYSSPTEPGILGRDTARHRRRADPPRYPGAELPHVHTLRSANDCQALVAAKRAARRVVVIGASFIGLEVAASLRARGLDVDIVAPETRPMEAVFGAEIGELVRRVHEQHGARFHLGTTAAAIDARGVSLHSGE
jgi:NADPH-dependent 2,4-dienoyl-CoA reductase/sulfur reductase-like enzyme